MRTLLTINLALLAAAMAYGKTAAVAPDRTVIVCLERPDVSLSQTTVVAARQLVSEMFAGIDIGIEWRKGLRDCPQAGIQISLRSNTPVTLKPGAPASALPFEGTHIQVFCDRILQSGSERTKSYLLAHVIMHEITHILQGTDAHSDHGIMEARWSGAEIRGFTWKPLEFRQEDIDRIYSGMAARTSRISVAINTAKTPAPDFRAATVDQEQ